MQTQKDKVIISTEDYPELAEYFSRKEAGDKCAGRFEMSLDSNEEGIVILSIDDVKLEGDKKKSKLADGSQDAAAVKLYKGKKKADAEKGSDEEEATETPDEEAKEDEPKE